MLVCPHCGNEINQYPATRVSIYGMYDCHAFKQFTGSTVDEVIDNWLSHCKQLHPAILGDHEVPDLGPTMLGPAIVLSDKKELRRVGEMLFPGHITRLPDPTKLAAFRRALMDDPDIPRLLASQQL